MPARYSFLFFDSYKGGPLNFFGMINVISIRDNVCSIIQDVIPIQDNVCAINELHEIFRIAHCSVAGIMPSLQRLCPLRADTIFSRCGAVVLVAHAYARSSAFYLCRCDRLFFIPVASRVAPVAQRLFPLRVHPFLCCSVIYVRPIINILLSSLITNKKLNQPIDI